MTDREKTMEFLKEYSKDFVNPSSIIAKDMFHLMERRPECEPSYIIKALFNALDSCKKSLNEIVNLYGTPKPTIQILADTEEGKLLIKNLIEMQNKKGS